MKRYLMDANTLIEAKRRYYGFDLCPGFWDCLSAHHHGGQVLSIDRVKAELDQGADDLKAWATQTIPAAFFAASDAAAVTAIFGQMLGWVQGQAQYLPAAVAEFAAVADGWLIAYAKEHGLVLVTHEALAHDARRKVPMPNVCAAFDVEYVDTFTMLRALGVSFSWTPTT